ncbi:MAG: hypothetical protein SGILL_007550, partial [Bacillariaceae sp.]
ITYYDENGEAVVVQENFDSQDSLAASLLSFSPTVFFVVLLPPIIFNSGYHILTDLFFRHLTPICIYAFGGTAICCGVVASLLYGTQHLYGMEASFLELLTFGALISATDPVSTLAVFSSKKVDPQLFYLVFGESMLNDAVGLVLFDALAHLLENHLSNEGADIDVGQEVSQFLFDFGVAFVGSLFLGIVFALGMAYFMKRVDFRKTPILELCLATTFMYLPFVMAEILHLSGIVTVLFAGIACKRYVEPNLSDITKVNADLVYRLTAHVTETYNLVKRCSAWKNQNQKQDAVTEAEKEEPTDYVTATEDNIDQIQQTGQEGSLDEELLQIPSSTSFEDDATIPWRTAHMMWFSGLRGAVSYGLVRIFPDTPNKAIIVVTTMILILLTTFLLGGTTELMLNFLHIPTGIDERQYMSSLERRALLPGFLSRFEASKLFPWVTRDGDIDPVQHKKDDADDPNDPELTPYENIEMVEDQQTHSITIVQTNRNGMIFDYGA